MTKKKHVLSLDFVTARTLDECQFTLHLMASEFPRRCVVRWGSAEQFRVEWIIRSWVRREFRLEFDGTVTEVVTGTRIEGYITHDTIRRMRRTIRVGQLAWVMVLISICLIAIFSVSHSRWSFPLLGILFGALAFSPPVRFERTPTLLVSVLRKLLYSEPDVLLDEEGFADEHESKIESQRETRFVTTSELCNRSHAGTMPRHF